MLFKKNIAGNIRITDVNPAFEITHTYFKLKESDYPSGSLLFKELLNTERIVVLSVEDNSKYKNYLSKFLYVDKKVEEKKEVEAQVHEEKQEEDRKTAEKEIKRLERIEKKKQKEKERIEKKKLENIIIINDDEIEESVAKHLLG